MTRNLFSRVQKCVLTVIALFLTLNASATHIYGGDFFYTWVSGNTYTISLVIYGDCSGSAFPFLTGATPQVEIYNGSTSITTITLSQQGSAVEVTPVCPSQLGNTTCSNPSNTIPGIKKFTYSANYTLSGTSANWRFLFNGTMGSTTSAGRSTSITNAVVGTSAGSIMQLQATLNNTVGNNSSPVYTTIPTPFFCINKAANYNPGAVDANGDALSYSLVAGLEPGGTVTYVSPHTATAPLAASTGTFSFSSATGQLAFTPNLVQRSLVVNQVTETRGSTVVGTSMREMTFVVLNNCNNRPPGGFISNTSGGTLSNNNTTVTACNFCGYYTNRFSMNGTLFSRALRASCSNSYNNFCNFKVVLHYAKEY